MSISKISEYGDFQTSVELAGEICQFLISRGSDPRSIVEPNCGIGNIVLGALAAFPKATNIFGVDINGHYIQSADEAVAKTGSDVHVQFLTQSFFDVDWGKVLHSMPRPLLVIGNPPWVTNSHLGVLGSANLPIKSNMRRDEGMDAITGKSNFDISEWMLLKLAQCLAQPDTSMALLCKTSVARKVLSSLWKASIPIAESEIVLIDAMRHFRAAVDACLLHIRFDSIGICDHAKVYPNFTASKPVAQWGFKDGMLLANVDLYDKWQTVWTDRKTIWRSGIKHDCSAVMELEFIGANKYCNSLNEVYDLEDIFLYPMLKSSHLNRGEYRTTSRVMLVPQEFVGQDTAIIAEKAPRTWAYLQCHLPLLKKRGSSIYKNRPPFSIFGVGPYAFAPWKVAISGLYKRLNFVAVGDRAGKPYVFDDTCYFLSCQTRTQAELLASLLNSSLAHEILESMIFWDAKRPITVDILERIDIEQMAMKIGSDAQIDAAAQCVYGKSRHTVNIAPSGNLFTALRS